MSSPIFMQNWLQFSCGQFKGWKNVYIINFKECILRPEHNFKAGFSRIVFNNAIWISLLIWQMSTHWGLLSQHKTLGIIEIQVSKNSCIDKFLRTRKHKENPQNWKQRGINCKTVAQNTSKRPESIANKGRNNSSEAQETMNWKATRGQYMGTHFNTSARAMEEVAPSVHHSLPV